MEESIVADIIEWDSVNWAKFLDFIEESKIDFQGKTVLAIGEHNGGMSLFFALKGAEVLCSDLDGPTEKARVLHKKYGVGSQIRYAAVDAVNISAEYNGQFDIVTFKSVIGGIGRNNNHLAQEKCVDSIYRILKRNGFCIFADNMRGSIMHIGLRKAFVPWGGRGTMRQTKKSRDCSINLSSSKRANLEYLAHWAEASRNGDFWGNWIR